MRTSGRCARPHAGSAPGGLVTDARPAFGQGVDRLAAAAVHQRRARCLAGFDVGGLDGALRLLYRNSALAIDEHEKGA